MKNKLANLLDALEGLNKKQPQNLERYLSDLPIPDNLPSAWAAWTLITLVRHRKRQYWVEEILRTRLGGSPIKLAQMGYSGHPKHIPPSGTVPDMPEWEYDLHGNGCCITNKTDGQSIDVDFWDETPEYFSWYFFECYLKSLRSPDPIEQRLLQLHPVLSTLSISVEELFQLNAIQSRSEDTRHPYRLSEEVIRATEKFDSFCQTWQSPAQRVWLAATIGDWMTAKAISDQSDFHLEIINIRAQQCWELRRIQLCDSRIDGSLAPEQLHSLAHLGVPDLDVHLNHALKDPQSNVALAALEIIGERGLANWCPQIFQIFKYVDAEDTLPAPNFWIKSLKFLIESGYRTQELVPSLANAYATELGEAVLLSLEHAPQYAIDLVRKSLTTGTPDCRTGTSAILALFNTEWSKRELLRAMNGSADQFKTAEVRAALLETGDPEMRTAVLAWEAVHPHEDETKRYIDIDGQTAGPFYSVNNYSLKLSAGMLRYDMQKFRDRVTKIKNIARTKQ